ncbi:hypothetical protein RB200_06755 [Streptomyces sp. PmtG]
MTPAPPPDALTAPSGPGRSAELPAAQGRFVLLRAGRRGAVSDCDEPRFGWGAALLMTIGAGFGALSTALFGVAAHSALTGGPLPEIPALTPGAPPPE